MAQNDGRAAYALEAKKFEFLLTTNTAKKNVEIDQSWNYDVNNVGCKFHGGGCFTNTKTP